MGCFIVLGSLGEGRDRLRYEGEQDEDASL